MMAIHAALYQLGCKVHWPAREQAIGRALDVLASSLPIGPSRLVDVGCGPGMLAHTALARNLLYLGVEPDNAFVTIGLQRYKDPAVSFCQADVMSMTLQPEVTDVIVVNGVAHHLDDEEIRLLLRISANAAGMIVCDHWRQPGRTGIVASLLQAADRGRYIRDVSFFERLPGFEVRAKEVFDIGLLGMPLWPYFCMTYVPLRETR